MYFFSADEHYGHKNIIKFCNRPFDSVKEMDEELIKRFNSVVGKKDTTIHAGDFTFYKLQKAAEIYARLNGFHVFLNGSHDYWLKNVKGTDQIWQKNCFSETLKKKFHITVCHYCMRTWPRSHYNSWHLYGHTHGTLPGIGKSFDVGVDCHDFYPVSLDQVVEIMSTKPDNPDRIKR